ncbi:hypothetical protein YYE_00679 [Plasmodium vinckei vinckei]|nr:hypothetical protein YYE_00679 [Plasmodium vinckei vinckei]
MKKTIYSLVTVVTYILSIVAIQCFINNDDLNNYFTKNKNVHGEYEINGIAINNNEEFRYRCLSEHSIENNYSSGSTTIREPSDNNNYKKSLKPYVRHISLHNSKYNLQSYNASYNLQSYNAKYNSSTHNKDNKTKKSSYDNNFRGSSNYNKYHDSLNYNKSQPFFEDVPQENLKGEPKEY